jgi:hypothetical protein
MLCVHLIIKITNIMGYVKPHLYKVSFTYDTIWHHTGMQPECMTSSMHIEAMTTANAERYFWNRVRSTNQDNDSSPGARMLNVKITGINRISWERSL